VLSLGATPVANALVDPANADQRDPAYPLELVVCTECSLVQLGLALPAEQLFDASYPYYSSFSEAFSRHAAAHVDRLVVERGLGPSSFAVEVASNDGYLLRHFVAAGVRTLGIDPSLGPAAAAEELGVPTIVGFFGVDAAEAIVAEHGQADVIIANNVMAHVPDLNDFVGGFATLLAEDGLVTIENPYVRDLIDRVEFDTIYHEHYCYFSCLAVDALMERHDLHLNDVEYFPSLHGGTLRWYVGRQPNRTERCHDLIEAELAAGMTGVAYYAQFAGRVRTCQSELRSLLADLTAGGRRVAAYGAAAKGATLLNTTGIGTELVDYVVDRNVHKHGKLMPGCRLPIRPVEVLDQDRPQALLLLAWNFADEIVAQQRSYADSGGTFYVPVPRPRQLDVGISS